MTSSYKIEKYLDKMKNAPTIEEMNKYFDKLKEYKFGTKGGTIPQGMLNKIKINEKKIENNSEQFIDLNLQELEKI